MLTAPLLFILRGVSIFGLYWKVIVYHQQQFLSHNTHMYAHTFLFFVSFSYSGVFVLLSSTFPPPPHPLSIYAVSTCTSLLLSHLTPFEV